MTITNHPLHRSGRALLTHPAPALGDDAKSPERIRVTDAGGGSQRSIKRRICSQRDAVVLAATPQRPVPVPAYMEAKRLQRRPVRRHTIVPVVSLNHRPQPLAHFRHSMMHSSRSSALTSFSFARFLLLIVRRRP